MANKEVPMKTSSMILQIATVLLLLTVSRGDETHPACKMWSRMARQLSTQQQRQMTCFANDTNPCTSLRCSGTYKYTSWMLPQGNNMEVDYCFGMRLNHCDNPVSLDIYLNVPAKNINYAETISHNMQVQVPGFSFRLKSLGTVDVFLYFHMLRSNDMVNISVTAKVRITALGGLAMWPQGMQRDIVPNEQIPVPPCTDKVVTTEAPMHQLGQCHPPTWAPPTLPPGVSSTTPNPYITAPPKSLTYNHYCGKLSAVCGEEEEVCDLKINKCQCHFNYLYNSTLMRCVRTNHYKRPCSSSSQCGQNEACEKICMCVDGYTFSDRKRACMLAPSVTFNKTCTEGVPICGKLESCNIALQRCVCQPDFHFSKSQQACVSQSRYLQPCTHPRQCGSNEECNMNRCNCRRDFTFNIPRQMCLREPTGGVTIAPPKVVTSPTGGSSQPHKQEPVTAPPANNVAIIAGAVVGGVVFIVLVSLFIFFMVRRARSPYQNREMLLSDDTDGIM